MPDSLMNAACAYDIHILTHEARKVLLCQSPTDFNQETPLATPHILQIFSSESDVLACEIVKHDYIRPCFDSLHSFELALALHFNLHGESSGGLCSSDRPPDATGSGNVIVFQHGHRAQIHAVGIASPNKHPILLNQPEAWGGLPCPAEDVLVASFPD